MDDDDKRDGRKRPRTRRRGPSFPPPSGDDSRTSLSASSAASASGLRVSSQSSTSPSLSILSTPNRESLSASSLPGVAARRQGPAGEAGARDEAAAVAADVEGQEVGGGGTTTRNNKNRRAIRAARRTIVFGGDDGDDIAEGVRESEALCAAGAATQDVEPEDSDEEKPRRGRKRGRDQQDDPSGPSSRGGSSDVVEATLGAWEVAELPESSSLLLSQEPSTTTLSSLMPSVGTNPTSATSHGENEGAERSDNDDAKPTSSSTRPTTSTSSSLFGSVMASAQKSSRGAACESRNDRTPVKSNVNNTSGTDVANAAAAMTMMMSPGGFKIMDFLNNLHNQSPMVPLNAKTRGPSTKSSGLASPTTPTTARHQAMHTTPLSTASTPSSFLHNDEDNDGWRDVNRDDPILDWAVYATVHVEIGGDLESTQGLPSADLDVEQEARTSFVTSQSAPAATTAAVPWRSSLLYWCFPHATCRVQLHPSSTAARAAASTAKNSATADTKTLSQSLSQSSSQLGTKEPSRSASFALAPPANKLLSNPGTARGTATVTMDDAGRRWQDAFRSLYRNWVRQVARHHDDQTLRFDDCYFYAVGIGHTVLFRATIDEHDVEAEKENGDAANDPSCLPRYEPGSNRGVQPQIVISASSPALRSKLRDMGVVHMRLLDRWDGHSTTEDFQEAWLTVPASRSKDVPASRAKDGNKGTTSSSSDAPSSGALEMSSPDVRAELAALRRAQALRQTVGATISISTAAPKSRADKPVAAPDRIPPLVVTGWDDCGAFMEVYLNTLGLQLVNWLNGNMDKESAAHVREFELPTLSCRRLGPFHHSSMESLLETNRSKRTVTLRGTILPCAVRDLVASTVRLAEEDSTTRFASPHDRPAGSGEAPSESHAAFRFQLHPGRPLQPPAPSARTASSFKLQRAPAGHMGTCTSAFLNTAAPTTKQHLGTTSDANTRKGRRLRCGHVLSTVVWDSEADRLISYRVVDHRGASYSAP